MFFYNKCKKYENKINCLKQEMRGGGLCLIYGCNNPARIHSSGKSGEFCTDHECKTQGCYNFALKGTTRCYKHNNNPPNYGRDRINCQVCGYPLNILGGSDKLHPWAHKRCY